MYKVKEKDLIGELEGFPIKIVQKMVDYQVVQGNKADVTLFQNNPYGFVNAFDWNKTVEGYTFWKEVILDKDFAIFFYKYPTIVELEKNYNFYEEDEDFIKSFIEKRKKEFLNSNCLNGNSMGKNEFLSVAFKRLSEDYATMSSKKIIDIIEKFI